MVFLRPHQDIEEAAHKAHCHEFIKILKRGTIPLLVNVGLKLSGGQRQRLFLLLGFS